MATSVGMMTTILGMKRTVNSMRAGTDSRPRIGPMMRPRNRSMLVHSPPPATWKKVRAHRLLVLMATMSPIRRAAAIGRPRTGTIENSGMGGGPPPASGGALPASVGVRPVAIAVSVMSTLRLLGQASDRPASPLRR